MAQQLEMAQAVKRALQTESHVLTEAPTGTGKSIAYLAPAILSGKTVVIATANKCCNISHQGHPFCARSWTGTSPPSWSKGTQQLHLHA